MLRVFCFAIIWSMNDSKSNGVDGDVEYFRPIRVNSPIEKIAFKSASPMS